MGWGELARRCQRLAEDGAPGRPTATGNRHQLPSPSCREMFVGRKKQDAMANPRESHEADSGPSTAPVPSRTEQGGSSATLFSISILFGAFCLGWTNSLAGGLLGGHGFLIGFATMFVLGLAYLLIKANRRVRHRDRTVPLGSIRKTASEARAR